MKKSQEGNEPIVSVDPQYLLLLLLFQEEIMKKKEKKEETIMPTFEPFLGGDEWLLGIMTLLLLGTPKSESKTTINIYTGSDK